MDTSASPNAQLGRRERKKRQTRLALAEAGLRLFSERGYDEVTVSDIAEAADTAVTTLFKHFPAGKRSLALDGAIEIEYGTPPVDRATALVAAVQGRAPDVRVLDALEAFIGERGPFAARRSASWAAHTELIGRTPQLRAYVREKWMEAEVALAEALAEAAGDHAGEMELRALARFVLETPNIAYDGKDKRAALARIFDRLRAGWPEL